MCLMVGVDAGQFTIGNGITIGVVVFGAGGAWVAMKMGLRDLKVQFREVHREMTALRDEFVRKDVDRERDKNIGLQLSNFEKELSRQARRIEEMDARRQK